MCYDAPEKVMSISSFKKYEFIKMNLDVPAFTQINNLIIDKRDLTIVKVSEKKTPILQLFAIWHQIVLL